MTIKVQTTRLLDLIGDLKHTTHPDPDSGAVHGILLYTARGYPDPGEPGLGDILAGTSTMHTAAGHTYGPCSGQMTQPMLWPLDRAIHVAGWFRAQAKETPDHTVEIGYDGKTITVRGVADPSLFGDDDSEYVEFKGLDVGKFPRGIWDVLQWDTAPERDSGRLQPRSDIPAAGLEPFVKVAGKRPIEIYRYHQKRPILVGIGVRYRGVIMLGRWEEMDKQPNLGASPYGEIYDPGLPPIVYPPANPESMLELAAEKVLSTQLASTGMLARAFKLKAAAAATLLDQLEMLGVISAEHGGRGRDVLVGKADLGAVLDKIRAQQPQQPSLIEEDIGDA